MKFFLCFCAFILTYFCANAQGGNPLTVGFEETISSKILGQKRTVLIHIPTSNGGSKIKDRGRYPVVYLLDGSDNFNSVVSIIEHMEESSLCPPTIVVGIVQADRLSELTTGTEKEFPNFVGKGEKFMSFVEKELIPYVDAAYPTTPYRTLIGHSVGGLTVVNTLLHNPNLFNSYVSLDGALWWSDQKVVKEAKTLLPAHTYKGKKLFLAMANRLERGVDTLSVQKDTSSTTSLIRSNITFIKELAKNRENGLRFKYKFYENDDHSSVRLIGEYDALRFVYDFYKLKIYDSELKDPNFNLESLLVAHYKRVSEQMGYIIKPSESQVNNLGYQMMRTKQYKKSEPLFKLNVANNPNSANCYDSLGDFYLETGAKTKAIESFKKALTLQAIPETKDKLEALLNDKKASK
ncbi:alpha/beta hydrolase-fold protein [Hymenobacter cellulosivorans]|uniref:Alpha/beta hydrolase-fold protein n=1 Tax=Hymenobacter cellulosivorans TaxID=2932249 RepID=A0ABY4F6K1_9BACT|nr:alpha/beta hydrolase-fold protein [Hymenobacter cellulosivorans]UOQ52299.1 alpha/beta hydrolase-fold protein [Hymenobacter cellulosivorans]